MFSAQEFFGDAGKRGLVVRARDLDLQGSGEVDGKHFHKALGVDRAVAVEHLHGIGLQRRQSDELSDVAQGVEMYCHVNSPFR